MLSLRSFLLGRNESSVVPEKRSFADVNEEYQALAVKLGIGLAVPTYDLSAVLAYLDAKYGGRDDWRWVPVRGRDIVRTKDFNDVTSRTYSKPIPYAVLKTIDEIETQYPEARFFISDERYESDVKDPFLMVTMDEGTTLYVVERWDEPAFRP